MLNIPKLTTKELISDKNFKEILEIVLACVNKANASKALALLLERKVGEVNLQDFPDYLRAYQDLTLLLKFEAISLLKDEEVIELIEKHALEALKHPVFFDRLKDKLFLLPIIFRDEFLSKLREALRRNRQKLGKKTLKIIQTRDPQPPLVCVWLLDYDNGFGTGKHTDFQRELYFKESPNPKTLDAKEKEFLEELLYFYDRLALTIRDPGGFASYAIADLMDVSKIDIKTLEKIYV